MSDNEGADGVWDGGDSGWGETTASGCPDFEQDASTLANMPAVGDLLAGDNANGSCSDRAASPAAPGDSQFLVRCPLGGNVEESLAAAQLPALQYAAQSFARSREGGAEISFPEPVVQNVIATVYLCSTLDLRAIAISARNAEYNPAKVNAAVLRLRRPKCTGLLFRLGRLMITGAKSAEDAHVGGKKMAKLCWKIGHPGVRFRGFKIENMIASVDCGFPIRLEGLANDHQAFCSYEPEFFSGLVYRYHRLEGNKVVLLIFVSGKVILTGCRTKDQVSRVFESVYPLLAQYSK